jgi:hypothetical protein
MKIQVNGIDYTVEYSRHVVTLLDVNDRIVSDVYFDTGVQSAIADYYDHNGEVVGDEYSVDLYYRFENIEENLQQIGEWLAATHPEA